MTQPEEVLEKIRSLAGNLSGDALAGLVFRFLDGTFGTYSMERSTFLGKGGEVLTKTTGDVEATEFMADGEDLASWLKRRSPSKAAAENATPASGQTVESKLAVKAAADKKQQLTKAAADKAADKATTDKVVGAVEKGAGASMPGAGVQTTYKE
jgi:hypothetical protein